MRATAAADGPVVDHLITNTPVVLRAENGKQAVFAHRRQLPPVQVQPGGTFYLGEQPARVERNPAASGAVGTFMHIGGIWIPSDPAAAPKLFILSDYCKQLDDCAPVPQKMAATNLAEFRQVRLAVRTPIIVVPAGVPGTPRLIIPLQAALSRASQVVCSR